MLPKNSSFLSIHFILPILNGEGQSGKVSPSWERIALDGGIVHDRDLAAKRNGVED